MIFVYGVSKSCRKKNEKFKSLKIFNVPKNFNEKKKCYLEMIKLTALSVLFKDLIYLYISTYQLIYNLSTLYPRLYLRHLY